MTSELLREMKAKNLNEVAVDVEDTDSKMSSDSVTKGTEKQGNCHHQNRDLVIHSAKTVDIYLRF